MKKPVIALAAFVAALSSFAACAQNAPLRGVGLLALEANDSHGLGAALPGGRNSLVETPDSGGGSVGARAMRGGDSVGGRVAPAAETAAEVAPAKPVVEGDPSAPAAPTPKRPSYRWQSLVPGAIK
jgi:hypothetical protein